MNMSFNVRDARGRTMARLDPMTLHLLPRPNGIENQSLERMIDEIASGSSRCRRLTWVFVGISAVALIGVAASPIMGDRRTWQDLVEVVTNPAVITSILAWVAWSSMAFVQHRRRQRQRVTAIMLKHRRCPHCGNSLSGLPVDPTDGATLCPGCAGAWRLDDAAIAAHCAASRGAIAPLSACRNRRLLMVALGLAVMAVALGVTFLLKT